LSSVVQRLQAGGVPTRSGKGCWRGGTVRHILRNPVYVGLACGNRFQVVPARARQSAMRPAGSGQSHVTRPEAEWITIPVPALVTQEADSWALGSTRVQRRRPPVESRKVLADCLTGDGQQNLGSCDRPGARSSAPISSPGTSWESAPTTSAGACSAR